MRADFCGIRLAGGFLRTGCYDQSKCDRWNKSIDGHYSRAMPVWQLE